MDFRDVFLTGGVIWAVISFFLLIYAWYCAKKRNIKVHKGIMILLTAGAWVFLIGYILRYRYGVNPEIPENLIPWFAFHGSVALLPFIGATALVWSRFMEPKRTEPTFLIRNHVLIGKIVIPLWCFTHIGGMINYWLVG